MTEPTDFLAELATTEARALELRRQIAQGSCQQYGHGYRSIGGCNAGCGPLCGCSVPVNECIKCGDCDYGDNDDARAVRRLCEERNAP
jgi:hypothetical protein